MQTFPEQETTEVVFAVEFIALVLRVAITALLGSLMIGGIVLALTLFNQGQNAETHSDSIPLKQIDQHRLLNYDGIINLAVPTENAEQIPSVISPADPAQGAAS